MNSQQLQDWLSSIGSNSAIIENPGASMEEYSKFLDSLTLNTQLLIQYVNNHYDQIHLIQPIVAQILFLYYKKGVFRYFALQLIPSFLTIYFTVISKRQKQKAVIFENFFIAIYNEEILAKGPGSSDMEKKREEIRIPSVICPSIYHDPVKMGLKTNEVTQMRCDGDTESLYSVKIGPYPAVERMSAENRYIVINRLIRSINTNLPRLQPEIIGRSLCVLALCVTHSGFNFPTTTLRQKIIGTKHATEILDNFSERNRIPINAIFVREMLTGVYYSIYNFNADLALRALEAIHQRAHHDMLSEILLVTRAVIHNLLENSPSKNSHELMYTLPRVKKEKAMLTNASLRIKKMPEDIPIVKGEEDEHSHHHKKMHDAIKDSVGGLKKKMHALKHDIKHDLIEAGVLENEQKVII
uniref:Hyccin n=1 Tax=Rhabditophanes sp. KR3021 TaxID=114890 RepID=A0AC35TZQ8_9BILA